MIKCYNKVPGITESESFLHFFFQCLNIVKEFDILAKEENLILHPWLVTKTYINHMNRLFKVTPPPVEIAKCFVRKRIVQHNCGPFISMVPELLQVIRHEKETLGMLIKQLFR